MRPPRRRAAPVHAVPVPGARAQFSWVECRCGGQQGHPHAALCTACDAPSTAAIQRRCGQHHGGLARCPASARGHAIGDWARSDSCFPTTIADYSMLCKEINIFRRFAGEDALDSLQRAVAPAGRPSLLGSVALRPLRTTRARANRALLASPRAQSAARPATNPARQSSATFAPHISPGAVRTAPFPWMRPGLTAAPPGIARRPPQA